MDYKEIYDEMDEERKPRKKIDGLTWFLIVGVAIGLSMVVYGAYMLLTI